MTTMTEIPAWLTALCRPDLPDTPVERPFGVTLGGAPWVVATDGHVLVALPGEGAAPLSSAMAARFAPYEARLTDSGGVVADFAALSEWIGPAPVAGAMVRCDDCGGGGRIIEHVDCDDCGHRVQCEECEGRGRLHEVLGPRPGRLGVAVINRGLLAPIWPHLTPGPVRVVTPSAEAPAGLHGPGWVVLVMPVRWGERPVEAFADVAS